MNGFETPVVVRVITEGTTESRFIQTVLYPYLREKGIVITSRSSSEKDNMGGNVSLERLLDFICKALRSSNCYVTTMFDFYGCKPSNWLAFQSASRQKFDSIQRSRTITDDLREQVQKRIPKLNPRRFIPYVSMHEFEALLFSEPEVLANELDVPLKQIEKVVSSYSNPEEIDDSTETAPSKRIDKICVTNRRTYDKVADGVSIANEIGIDAMRAKCPIFNAWIESLENLSSSN